MYQHNEWFRSFHTVASTGSFALAAEYLSVGRPTVSEQVGALEEKFAVELFHRDGRWCCAYHNRGPGSGSKTIASSTV
ncbi:hypothetical protein BR1R5_16350 [Pseudomonas sp. BR1R-5]|uniref:Putative LysR family transcriptional regulator n=1 Tax=Pseudomonas putida TaxID=303 RepID=A0A379KNI1_PSEPU|nr:DNA-binding transcriptional ArsR family regulator [Pseudomonas sp. M2]GLH32249.1 hypothetical protein BR1R5_16350 [Pseudomonas sp. BR1R-5]SUD69612.1 putative LysR family transcriptional regulator [Pseudomonas putida]